EKTLESNPASSALCTRRAQRAGCAHASSRIRDDTTMAQKVRVLSLYKRLLREAEKFDAYNYRCYALRRIRDAFREHQSIEDFAKIGQLIAEGESSLEMIKRQVIIGHLYKTSPLVVENFQRNEKPH
ncbi:bcn92-like protein, partial [Dinothrombium tinctorium]